MSQLIVYMLRSYSASQRYFAPLATIIISVLFLYTYKPNPVMNSYAATAVILFAGCAWLGLSFLNHEQAVHRRIAVVHLRSAVKYSLGGILTLAAITLVLALAIVIYPVATGNFSEPAGVHRMALALAGHLLLGMLGISLSLYLQSSWVPRSSYAIGIMLAVLILSIGGAKLAELIPGPLVPILLPPAATVMDALMNENTMSFWAVFWVFGHALIYIILLCGFYLYRSSRMDYGNHL